MKRRLITVLFAIVTSLCLLFGMTACSDKSESGEENNSGTNTEQGGSGSGGEQGGSGSGSEQGGSASGEEQETPEHAHNYTSAVTTQPTCTAEGVMTYTCTCGDSYTVSIPATDHTAGTTVIENEVAATCTKDGSYDEVICCMVCNTELSRNTKTVEATGHTFYDAWTTNDEEHWKVCELCGDIADNGEHSFDGRTCTICDLTIDYTPGLSYELGSDNTYTVSGIGTATESDIVIPSEYMGLPVTAIGDSSFDSCSLITSVTIPNSITSIGEYAFGKCTSLTAIIVAEDNKNYSSDDGILFNANKTTLVCYPAGKADTSYTTPDGVTAISAGAFYGCNKLTDIVVADSVTSIGSAAFGGCSALQSITLPFIGGSANASDASASTLFGYIFGTDSYSGGESTTQRYDSIYYIKYYIPTSLTDVTITGDNILYGAFYNCSYIKNITLSDTITTIGEYAFDGCSALTSIIIPDSVTSIGRDSFYDCTSLTSVTIGESVTSIGDLAFGQCTAITEIYYNATACTKAGSSIFYNAGKNYSGITVTIGANVKSIPDELFRYSTSTYAPKIVTVVFEEGSVCQSIGTSAFSHCTSLTTVYYGRTAESWNGITIGSGNTPLTSASIYYYSESVPELNEDGTAYDGNYWHYVDGEIVVWTYTAADETDGE